MASGGAFGGYAGFARRFFAAMALATILPAASAEASARLCRQLETQLAATSSGGGSSAKAKRYDAAIARQQEQMRKARSQMEQAGCGRAMFGRGGAFCAEVRTSLTRMEKNLAKLQQTRARMGGGANRQERARIKAALEINGCHAPKRALPAATKVRAEPADKPQADVQPANRRLSGNFRTMCVRSCDGYYFPISWSVSQAAFERDRNICASMCPGVDVQLYYHRVPNEESDAMVSVATGAPYTQMPNAFLYRKPNASVPQGCSCEAAATAGRGFTVINGNGRNEETPAKPANDFHPAMLKRLATPEEKSRPVRVVGPAFLPDPEAATGLQVPARDPVR